MVVDYCVACHKPIPLEQRDNHKCSKKTESGRLAAQRRYAGHVPQRQPSYGERLAYGFEMIQQYNMD